MSPQTDAHRKLTKLFATQSCWMITPLAKQMNYSIPSVRRFLAQTGYYSSFTHNGQWYTLASIPQFSPQGLWFHQNIGYSRAGSLTNTLIALVTKSPTGMTAEQLGTILRCRCHSVLVKLYRQDRLQRQKLGRSYVYLAPDQKTADYQWQATSKADMVQLPAEIAVLVLVEFLRNPKAGFGKLANTVSKSSGLTIKTTQIKELFDQHGLKKTA